jgi:hypothetical protein
MTTSGCASLFGYKDVVIPTIEYPNPPEKPKITSDVIQKNDKVYVAYQIGEAMKLYEFLLQKDAYEDKLRYRIDIMNKLIQEKK